ncbi:MAG: type II secretion system F family protein [Chloroflexota bacterium]
MDTIMATAIVAAVGAGAVTAQLLAPAEFRRLQRIAGLAGSPTMRLDEAPPRFSPRRGLLARGLAAGIAFLNERDEDLVVGAGLSGSRALLYRQWRPLLPILAGLLTVAFRWGTSGVLARVAAAVAAAVLLPEVILRIVASRRREAMIREFPELVDLLAVAAAGGSSLAGALSAVVTRAPGPLSLEMRLAVREAAAGTPLPIALRHLAGRVALPAVTAFVGSLCEAESLGVPLAESLAVQSESARTAYRQQVEARLGQLPLQMTICALVFLFPTAFIVVALPNIIAFTSGLW